MDCDWGPISGSTLGTLQECTIKSVISSAFAIVHNKLNCDLHQAECKKLRSIYHGLGEKYSNLQAEEDADILKNKLALLNLERAQIIKNTAAVLVACSITGNNNIPARQDLSPKF